jgi:hypothetical protein
VYRKLNVLHGWLGIVGGVVVLGWYFTAIGEHWRYLPGEFSHEERQRTLGEPFSPAGAGKSFTDILAGLSEPAQEVRLRRAGSRLVYEVRTTSNRVDIVDAQTGESLLPVDESFARDIAQAYLPDVSIKEAVLLAQPDMFGSPGQYRITFDDFGETRVYVAPTASIASRLRVREWVNRVVFAKLHTLNFNGTFFRQYPGVTDVALLVLNTFALLIVGSGAVLAFWRMIRNGFFGGTGLRHLFFRKWHYVLGLIFSVTTLGFVISGFYLVLPDGTVPQSRVTPRARELEPLFRPLDSSRVAALSVASGGLANVPHSMVTLKHLLDVPIYIFQDPLGRLVVRRADTGEAFTVDRPWLARVASAFLGKETALSDVRYLDDYSDYYYYARNNRFPPLPVYRVTADNEDRTLLYVSAATGELTGRATRDVRWRRWLVTIPHTWDWPFLLRRPALWDAVSATLILGGLAVTLSGLYLGWQMLVTTWKRRRQARPTYRELRAS